MMSRPEQSELAESLSDSLLTETYAEPLLWMNGDHDTEKRNAEQLFLSQNKFPNRWLNLLSNAPTKRERASPVQT